MQAYVVNVDSQPERWASIRENLWQFGIESIRWPAYVTGNIENWRGHPIADPGKAVAIVRSYLSLLRYLGTRLDDPWLITQDDMIFDAKPEHGGKPVTLYAENRLYRGILEDGVARADFASGGKLVDAREANHVHPLAFSLTHEAIRPIIELLEPMNNNICVLWAPYITNETTTIKVVARHPEV